jgi:hypothetical protein
MSDADAKTRRLADAKMGGKSSAARRAEQAAKVDAFRLHLEGLTNAPDPVRDALIASACALYGQILKQSRFSGGVNRRVNTLHISAAVTGLRGLLKELGAMGAEMLEEPSETVEDILRTYATKSEGNQGNGSKKDDL